MDYWVRIYRVYPEKKDGRLTGMWKQKKDWHKPGEGVAACRFMHGADIDKLCIAGRGAGGRMLRTVTMRAQRAIAEWRSARRHSGIGRADCRAPERCFGFLSFQRSIVLASEPSR